MKMTLPRLKFGLLVGIGGGVPAKTDDAMIRLGDVEVSRQNDLNSGVVQYDRGKAKTAHFEGFQASCTSKARVFWHRHGPVCAPRLGQISTNVGYRTQPVHVNGSTGENVVATPG